MSMKPIGALLLFVSACGSAEPASGAGAIGSTVSAGSCMAPSETIASVEMTGFPPGKFTGPALKAHAGWLSASTPTCTLRWLRIQAGIFDVSIVHPAEAGAPATLEATAVPGAGPCVPANAPAVVSVGGGAWVSTAGSVKIATSTQADGLRSSVSLTSNDLVIKNPATGEVRNVTFAITTSVGNYCATLVSGDPAGTSTWQVRSPTVSPSGAPACSPVPVGGEWTGQPTPLSPPWNCSAKSGATPQALTPVNAKDAQ